MFSKEEHMKDRENPLRTIPVAIFGLSAIVVPALIWLWYVQDPLRFIRLGRLLMR